MAESGGTVEPELVAMLHDLAGIKAVDLEVVGQGALGLQCKFCRGDDWGHPFVHDDTCVWQRAVDYLERLPVAVTERGNFGFDFQTAIATSDGSTVANVLLRRLREAMGLPNDAMPFTPRDVWEHTLAIVQSQSGRHG